MIRMMAVTRGTRAVCAMAAAGFVALAAGCSEPAAARARGAAQPGAGADTSLATLALADSGGELALAKQGDAGYYAMAHAGAKSLSLTVEAAHPADTAITIKSGILAVPYKSKTVEIPFTGSMTIEITVRLIESGDARVYKVSVQKDSSEVVTPEQRLSSEPLGDSAFYWKGMEFPYEFEGSHAGSPAPGSGYAALDLILDAIRASSESGGPERPHVIMLGRDWELDAPVTIPDGVHVLLSPAPFRRYTIRRGKNLDNQIYKGAFFKLAYADSSLTLAPYDNPLTPGTVDAALVLDGGAQWSQAHPANSVNLGISATDALISASAGTLALRKWAILQHNERSGGTGGALDIGLNAAVRMSGGKILKNKAKYGGGALFNSGDARMEGGIFESNAGTDNGGALHINAAGARFTLSGGAFVDNRSAARGGAFVLGNGVVRVGGPAAIAALEAGTPQDIEGRDWAGRDAPPPDGGAGMDTDAYAAYVEKAGLVLFKKNSAASGGAVEAISGGYTHSVTVYDALFEDNAATTGNGGAISVTANTTTTSFFVKNSLFRRNSSQWAAASGGALYVNNGGASKETVTVSHCLFAENGPLSRGGAICAENPYNLLVERSVFKGNKANMTSANAGQGGAVFFTGGAGITQTIQSCVFEENEAYWGGAVFLDGASRFAVGGDAENRTVIAGNVAVAGGGGINFKGGSPLALSYCDIRGNRQRDSSATVTWGGGGIRYEGTAESGGGISAPGDAAKSVFGKETRIAGNAAAAWGGGGILLLNGRLTFEDGVIGGGAGADANFCAQNGGGVALIGAAQSARVAFTLGAGAVCSGNGLLPGADEAALPQASAWGGGIIAVGNAELTVAGEVSGNTAAVGGGGIHVNPSNAAYFTNGTALTLALKSGARVTGNTVAAGTTADAAEKYAGGGIHLYSSVAVKAALTIEDGAEVSGNTALRGGGIFAYCNAGLAMAGGSITGNEAAGDPSASAGGGVCLLGNANYKPVFTMSGGFLLEANTAARYGGALYADNVAAGAIACVKGTFKDNAVTDAAGEGHVVLVKSGAMSLGGGSAMLTPATAPGMQKFAGDAAGLTITLP